MTSYVNPFTGQTISPTQTGYEELTISVDTELAWPVNGNNTQVVANIIDVVATTTGLKLYMPPALQVSTGQSILIRNSGTNTFTVVDNAGGTIVAIDSGISEYIYITDNTSVAGVWASVTFGAGTSSANASALAGSGLLAISTTLNQSYPVVIQYSNTTLSASNRAQFIVWESGVGVITLPTASAVGNNWFVMVRNNGTGILTLQPQGLNTIDSNSNQQLQITESLVVCCDGSNFYTFGYGQAVNFVFTQLAKLVTGGTVTLTTAEASNIIQEYYGTLTSNCEVILPSTVQLYALNNKTTGAYSLTFKTTAVGASTVVLPQNQTIIAICDGTNVYNSQTASTSVLAALTLGNGTAANPSLNFLGDTTTGLYLPASGQLAVALAGANAGTFTSGGLKMPIGVVGGAF